MDKLGKGKISLLLYVGETISKILAQAVREALLKPKQAVNPVEAWCDSKVAWISPEEILVEGNKP